MAEDLPTIIETILRTYAAEVKAKFDLPIDFNPEDQLKSPITTLFKSTGTALKLKVEAVTEVHAELGRPDVGVAVKDLLAGHVELKAPGKGADPDKFKGDDKGRWEPFKNLPNLFYTNGTEWALYRSGQEVGKSSKVNATPNTTPKQKRVSLIS